MSAKTKNPLIVANWKMNGLLESGVELLKKVAKHSSNSQDSSEIVVCPPFTLLHVASHLATKEKILIGAQNCSNLDKGALTGEISAVMLKDIGCEYVLLGHSERRGHFNEASILVHEKALIAHEHGIKTIICVGETLEQRATGIAEDVITMQVEESLPNTANLDNTIIAYEPVWSIGTNKIPALQQIYQMHNCVLRSLQNCHESFKDNAKVIYGGSVKSSNADEILSVKNVSGLLVGGASLVEEEFIKIIDIADKY